MKKIIQVFIVTMLVSTAYSKESALPDVLNTPVKQVVSLADISAEMTKELGEGLHPDIAIECKEGTELPFKYKGKFGLFSVHYAPNISVKVEKTCYFRLVPKRTDSKSIRAYISYDLKTWEKAAKIDGALSADLGMSDDRSHVLFETDLVETKE